MTDPRTAPHPAEPGTSEPRTAGPPYRRAVPPQLDDEQRERLRSLLDDPEHWVLRTSWARYLRTGDEQLLVRTDRLTQEQRTAAHAWLGQQRHALYRALEGASGEAVAPDGWLDQLAMVRAFVEQRAPSDRLWVVPRQPGGPDTWERAPDGPTDAEV